MYIVHVCLEKVILIWCKILFNSIIKNVLLGITSTDYVRMKKYGESFEFKCVNYSSNTVLYFLHDLPSKLLLEKVATLYDNYNKAGNCFQIVDDSESDVSSD